jgi:hypothetical protein
MLHPARRYVRHFLSDKKLTFDTGDSVVLISPQQ